MVDFNKLIPELPDWNNGRGIEVESWIQCMGEFEKTVGYTALFWPRFKEIDGFIVGHETTPDNVRSWVEGGKGDRKTVEATMNHIHLAGLHEGDEKGPTPAILSYLGKVMKQMYQCKLNIDFPDREFVVEFVEPGDEEDLEGYVLTFFQK